MDISRKAELYETSSGMITITGGKLTTWRRMAKMTVDRLVERDARDAPCRTHEIPLGQAIAAEELPRVEGVPAGSYQALASRYGHAAHDVLALAADRGSRGGTSELAQPILDGLPDLLAEVALAARREQARSIGDVLLRRTRLGLLAARELTADPASLSAAGGDGVAAVRRVGDVLARELHWSPERLELELERFAEEAAAEGIGRGGSPDRRSADAALRRFSAAGADAVSAPPRRLRAVELTLELGERPWLMGIVNASPDSFSDGGLSRRARRAAGARRRAARGRRRHPRHRRRVGVHRPPAGRRGGGDRAGGAAGASASPGSSARWCRSTPTSRPSLARRSPRARASSTTSAACATRDLPTCAQQTGAALVIMHTRAAPRERLQDPDLYEDVVAEVLAFLAIAPSWPFSAASRPSS